MVARPESDNGLLTLAQASAYAGVSVGTIRRWCRSGELAAVHASGGGETLIRAGELEAHLTSRTAPAPAPEKPRADEPDDSPPGPGARGAGSARPPDPAAIGGDLGPVGRRIAGRGHARSLESRLEVIEEATLRLNRIQDVAAICETIVTEAADLLEADTYRVYRVDERAGVCSLIASRDREGRDPPYDIRVIPIGRGITGWVAEHGVPVVLRDAERDVRAYWVDGRAEPTSMLVVPMCYEEKVEGVIVLDRLGLGRFDSDDLTTLSIVAGHAAQAIRNADSFGILTRQREEMAQRVMAQRSLLEIAKQLQGKRDMHEVLEFIADSLQRVVANDALLILLVDRDAGVLRPVLSRDPSNTITFESLPLDAGLSGWVTEHGVPVLANDAALDPRTIELPGTVEEAESLIVVPLISEGVVTGTLNVTRIGEGNHFSEIEFDITKLFAAQAGAALQSAAGFDALERQRRELEHHVATQRMLFEVNRQLLSTLEPGAVLDTIADCLADLVRHDTIAFYRADAGLRAARCIFARGRYADQRLADVVPLDLGVTGRVFAGGEPALANDAHLEAARRDVPGTPAGEPESLIVVPLVAPILARGTIGTLLLARIGGEHRFSEAEFELVKLFAAQASIALQNAESFERLSRQQAELERYVVSQRRLLEVSERLLQNIEPTGVLDMLAKALHSVVAYDSMSIQQLDVDRGVRHPVYGADAGGPVAESTIPLRGLGQWVVEHREAALANRAHLDPRRQDLPMPLAAEALVVAPLFGEGRVKGLMFVVRNGEDAAFSESEFELVKLFAAQASTALERAWARRTRNDPDRVRAGVEKRRSRKG